ncbi:MAG: class I SAM-dependent methyltransferase [Fibrobacteres bacterium]|nr:class I SAM-dependent methyltransferase [Fibrobacterota bacterium]
MKYRDSGMPDETMWTTFFSPEEILQKMDVLSNTATFLDIGCGYGTFLLPASRIVNAKAIGMDIEPSMLKECSQKAADEQLTNIELIEADLSAPERVPALRELAGKVDYAALFNILHCEEPVALLRRTAALLSPNGRIGAIHWQYRETPRGPTMDIRPKPGQIVAWGQEADLQVIKEIDLPPYHYGIIFIKGESA